jgi:uncharacterized membrane protein YphA (DoxX/SURF4 family)
VNLTELLAHPYTVVLARWLLAAVLLVAGISKLLDREGFVQAVDAYQILPVRLARVVALGLPYLEIVLGVFLLTGLATRMAAILAIWLFATFAIAVAINLVRRRELDCHCFGNLWQGKIGLSTLLRNLILVILSIQILIFADGYLAIDGWIGGGFQGMSLAGAISVGFLVVVIVGLAVLISAAQRTLTDIGR